MPAVITWFRTPLALRRWFARHHAGATELLAGFRKRDSGLASITWPESVDEALCVGWIDGVRKRVDEASYTIRFTPRKKGSIWSAVNIRRAQALVADGRMQAAGLRAFEARTARKSVVYAYEQTGVQFDPATADRFRKHKVAWAWFEAQAPWYRRKLAWWVQSAKREVTRELRLAKLIEASTQGRRL
jgi:uncharacterized protein YdeI (YjbR/CyaY-like superfamily)